MRSGNVLPDSLFIVHELADVLLAVHPLRSIRKRVVQPLIRLDDLLAQICADASGSITVGRFQLKRQASKG